jgi:uncharacterized protein (DUF362 family)
MLAAAPLAKATEAPSAPVSIARARTYDGDLPGTLSTMFDQLGGLGRIVKNKTVTVKLNLTGSPSSRFQGKPLGLTHYTHPNMAAALAYVMDRSGARRVRFVESCWATSGSMEEYLVASDWNVKTLFSAAKNVEFVNTNGLGYAKRYVRFKVPGGGSIFPGYDLHPAYQETDVFVSLAKLKNHATCGVTLSMKNCFGITPASIYGDDAGEKEPNEHPTSSRGSVCHSGRRGPSKCSPQEIDPRSSRDPGYRMPRIVADLAATRPIDLAIIDGIETVTGGEGPWIHGLRFVQPGVILAGTNATTTDTVATAVMGYDPRASKGNAPFTMCDNSLLLAEARGVGTADLKNIEVRGLSVREARFPFAGAPKQV